jgi:hypothetical protein
LPSSTTLSPMQLENEVRISSHFNTFTPHHPGFLQDKRIQLSLTKRVNEEKVEMNVKEDYKPPATQSPDKKLIKRELVRPLKKRAYQVLGTKMVVLNVHVHI